MLIERIQQQLRIIVTAYRYFGTCEDEIKFIVRYIDGTWHYVQDGRRTVLSIMHGMSDSTDTRFVAIRNHITGVGYVYTSVTDNQLAELENYLADEEINREHS